MSTASQTQEKKFGDDAGLLHQIALSLRAVCKDEVEARAVATKLAHDRPFLTNVVTQAIGKPKKRGSLKGLVNSDLLEPVTKVSTSAIEGFGAKEKFQVGTQDGVKITYLGPNFQKYFLSGAGTNEVDIPAQTLRIHKLRKNSKDDPIIKELGGKELIVTNLACMYELMKAQGDGREGTLLTDGKANVFYICAVQGDLETRWAVDCHWLGDGWNVGASPMTDPLDWVAGDQFFSR